MCLMNMIVGQRQMTHLQRYRRMSAIHWINNNECKERCKPENKQCFMLLLNRLLQQVECQVSHAKGDADMLIVQSANESASQPNKLLVGDDTDLLILPCFHTPMSIHEFLSGIKLTEVASMLEHTTHPINFRRMCLWEHAFGLALLALGKERNIWH